MDYIRLHDAWEDAEKAGDIKAAIALIREQIATNLVIAHNKFSDELFCAPREAWGHLSYNRVRPEARKAFMPFARMDYRLIELDRDGESRAADAIALKEHIDLERQLIEALNPIEDDGASARKYEALHARYLRHLSEPVELSDALGDALREGIRELLAIRQTQLDASTERTIGNR